ncbi:hypothetical protein NDU88_006923 [Pleurodeles waltl]|uniref:Uncharacterized protein n=1 Tax=Pleurodeles waltl TaxID=8319 RepID=A0AAV7PNB3_PLEWA|nr:hypothetical protein NDU88_006923 [Pleurodeles waltl]
MPTRASPDGQCGWRWLPLPLCAFRFSERREMCYVVMVPCVFEWNAWVVADRLFGQLDMTGSHPTLVAK